MRKSPTKHIVKSHLRKDGKTHVKSYTRGSGSSLGRDLHLANPYINKPEGYSVELIYPDKTPEKIEVIATTYQHAIDEAFKLKTDPRLPEEIIVTDPSLKEVIHWAGAHAQQVGKIAAQKSLEYGKKAAIAGGNYAKNVSNDVIDVSLEHTAQGKGFAAALAKKQLERRGMTVKTSDESTKKLIDEAYSTDNKTRIFARAKLRTEHPDIWRVMDTNSSINNSYKRNNYST